MVFAGVQGASAQNQQLLSKKGEVILPEKGDIALGIDAVPFFGYIGNMFNGNGLNGAPTFSGVDNPNTIFMKYFLTDKTAVRASLSFGFDRTYNKSLVRDDWAFYNDPTLVPAPTAVDVQTVAVNDFKLNLGYEMRRGKGRVQGFYGGQLGVGFNTATDKYAWANNITFDNQTPTTTTNFATGANAATGTRNLTVKHAPLFTFSAEAFVGVEYFFAPKISLAGEFDLGMAFSRRGQGGYDYTTTETYAPASSGVVELENRNTRTAGATPSNPSFSTIATGKIALLFHF